MPMDTEPVRPDYDGASVVGVVPALLGRPSGITMPEPVRDASAAVLLVLDGFGWTLLGEHRRSAPALSAMAGGPVTTVVPSTTGAALTSITTGVPPAEHGIVGYRMRVNGRVLDVLRWQLDGGGAGPDPASVTGAEPFAGKEIPVITRTEFARTGFTIAHMRGARQIGWRTTATLVEHCRRLIASGERFVYAYYDGIDRVAHEYGLHDGYLPAEVAATDGLVGDLLDALPSDVAVVVTADHGQVHFGAEGWRTLDAVASLVDAYAGDGRFRYLYAKPGAASELEAAARRQYGGDAWVFSREQLVDERWLGPDAPSPEIIDRLGDVVLAARGPIAFFDPTHPSERGLVAGHGSLEGDEMRVPLLAARGTG